MRKSYLHGGQNAIGSMDDAYWMAEAFLKKAGEGVGKELGMTKQQADRHNKLLKTVREFESKAHTTHSPLARHLKFLRSFDTGKKNMLDSTEERWKRVMKNN